MLTHLGLTFDTRVMTISLPREEVKAIKAIYKGNIIAYIPGYNDAGANQLCQHGSISNKASLTSPSVLAEGNVQV